MRLLGFGRREVEQKETGITEGMVRDYLRTFGIGVKLTDEEMDRFVMMAVSQQLNPLKKEIHCAVYVSNEGVRTLSIMTGYEVYLRRAEATGKLEWWTVELDAGTDFTQMKATVTIKRKDREHPWSWEVWYTEASQSGSPLWKRMPRHMLRKTAMAQAFRLYFPQELGGAPYIKEEMGEADNVQVETVEAIPVNFRALPPEPEEARGIEAPREESVDSERIADTGQASARSATFGDLVKLVNKSVPQSERPGVMAEGRKFVDDPEEMGRYIKSIEERYS